jgi:hypothetical protein
VYNRALDPFDKRPMCCATNLGSPAVFAATSDGLGAWVRGGGGNDPRVRWALRGNLRNPQGPLGGGVFSLCMYLCDVYICTPGRKTACESKRASGRDKSEILHLVGNSTTGTNRDLDRWRVEPGCEEWGAMAESA